MFFFPAPHKEACKLFVKNLPAYTNEAVMLEHFPGALKAYVPTFPDGNIKGYVTSMTFTISVQRDFKPFLYKITSPFTAALYVLKSAPKSS